MKLRSKKRNRYVIRRQNAPVTHSEPAWLAVLGFAFIFGAAYLLLLLGRGLGY